MKIILDNCVRRRLIERFVGHEVSHAMDLGWETLKNGQLLRQANERFDILVTVDKNMRFQSNLAGMQLSVAVLNVRGNDYEQLLKAVDQLLGRLENLPNGEFTVITVP